MSNRVHDISSINLKDNKGEDKLDIVIGPIAMIFIIIGAIVMIIYSLKQSFKKYNAIVLNNTIVEDVCSCKTDCTEYSHNLCKDFCSIGSVYVEEKTFKCAYIKSHLYLGNNNTCDVAVSDKGFYYPEFNEVWYNYNYDLKLNLTNIPDDKSMLIWYNEKTHTCKKTCDNYFNTGLILFIIGIAMLPFSRRMKRMLCKNKNDERKSSNFINEENIDNKMQFTNIMV